MEPLNEVPGISLPLLLCLWSQIRVFPCFLGAVLHGCRATLQLWGWQGAGETEAAPAQVAQCPVPGTDGLKGHLGAQPVSIQMLARLNMVLISMVL